MRTFKPKSLFKALKRKIDTHGSAYDLSASLMPLPKSSSYSENGRLVRYGFKEADGTMQGRFEVMGSGFESGRRKETPLPGRAAGKRG